MTKLTDTQSILLASAAGRDTGSIMPLPTSLKASPGGIAKSLASLTTRGFIEEREVSDPALVHCSDGDLRVGLFITRAGLEAIGLPTGEDQPELAPAPILDAGSAANLPDTAPAVDAPQPKPERQPKSALVLALVRRQEGATLPELIEATGWLPHTTRAALTGLRKKGIVLDKSKRDEVTCYRAVSA